MTDTRSELEQVIAEWRARAGYWQATARSLTHEGPDADAKLTALAYAHVFDLCAIRLSAILQRSPQQEGETLIPQPETKDGQT